MGLQAVIPLRFALYPSEVRWAGEGHRFAWRMRLYDRQGRGHFEATDRTGGARAVVEPTSILTERQAAVMLTRPDMILQFAHHLKDAAAARGHPDARVHAHMEMSLNGRPYQALVKPEANLGARRWRPWAPADFVTELTTELRPWRERAERARAEEAEG